MSLLEAVTAALTAVADPSRAPAMQRYMKSTMPFLGVPQPLLRRVLKPVWAAYPLATAAAWRREVRAMWRAATVREHRYAAIELTELRAHRGYQDLDALPLYAELITTGAWWDLVDPLAGHRLRFLLEQHGAPIRAAMLEWSRGEDLWLRRAAILCQLGRKSQTDLELLYAVIEPALPSREFFLRKAIGWALRDLARAEPDEVRRYVAAHESRLSGLSKREALKHL
jgi:3-methyladenine DNA glycosylase AlkD